MQVKSDSRLINLGSTHTPTGVTRKDTEGKKGRQAKEKRVGEREYGYSRTLLVASSSD
jgi:hypothetical protein